VTRSLKLIIQNQTDLVLAARRTAGYEGLKILQSEKVLLPNAWEVTFHILGESHSVVITRKGKSILQEVLACTKPEGTEWLYSHSFSNGQPHAVTDGSYTVSVKFFENHPIFSYMGTDVQHLEEVFEHPFAGRHPPFTRIWWDVFPQELRWKTLHVYPTDSENATVVYSSSSFKL
jgi:hypothetical protein